MRIILHADMNSYFASVEQQANPFLRGKPVAICSRLSPNACIIACSIEAKKLGIKTGFSLGEAQKIAPRIVALEVDPAKIRTTTQKIFAIFADFTSALEAYSIDEAFLDLSGHIADFAAARELALRIKSRIRNEVGEWLGCSIGIAPTRWLAKFAGELEKPDGLTVLLKEDLPKVYAGRPVDEAWGIADGWKTRLAALSINTLGELLAYDPLELKRIFGISGYILWANIAGLDIEKLPSGKRPPQSIGHSYVFGRRTAAPKEVSAIMMKLCERVGRRLRGQNLEARQVNVNWASAYGAYGKIWRSNDAFSDSYQIFKSCEKVFGAAWDRSTVNYLAVTVSGLTPVSGQTSIFPEKEIRRRVSSALDAVNSRYGEYAIVRGQMLGAENYAPDRIGFRQSVEPLWNGDSISISPEPRSLH
jgi:DNA polymerase IV